MERVCTIQSCQQTRLMSSNKMLRISLSVFVMLYYTNQYWVLGGTMKEHDVLHSNTENPSKQVKNKTYHILLFVCIFTIYTINTANQLWPTSGLPL